ncbi:hypothetical protein [Mucilaginibacter sp.]|jgi:hypothetical protein|uniref:hypothetical protein n=1 Tax=Mucilaginibacter sp. TaxID=1882438 RepID=UPI002CD465DF|nr:hypothetical protein [Mucilaginibacter sp.]HTI60794.1 hypothetical protein [Mucilaginibacter sp.]
MAAKLTILTFPQKLLGNKLSINALIIPRNIDPTQPLAPGTPPFQSANLKLQAKVIADLSIFPSDLQPSTSFPLAGVAIPAGAPSVFSTLAAKFNVSVVGDAAPPANANHFIQKYLPLSYRSSFNFTNPRVKEAVIDDSYACAVRSTVVNPAFVNSDPTAVSWGQVFAYLLRQPDLARSAGFLQSSTITIDVNTFPNGGWLWIDLDNGSDYFAESQADKGMVKKYAARIPALVPNKNRNVFAAVQFPVLFKQNAMDPDPVPAGNFDPIFIEASEYDTGFSKIVHTYQPVNNNFVKEEEDPESLPTKDLGIRIGWDDEQLLIWQNRQMAEDPDKPGTGLRVDSPLGVAKYRVDVRLAVPSGQAENPWTSLAMVKSKTNITLGPVQITPNGKQFELGTEVYPSQIDGNTSANFWLPSYFTQWVGKSLVLSDADAAVMHKTDQAGAVQQTLYDPVGEGSPGLFYGNVYDFRVRMTDFTGGGPVTTHKPDPDNQGPAPVSTIHFKRYVVPQQLNWPDKPINGDLFTGTSVNVTRPRLGYPAVVFTKKYPNAIALLKADADAAAGNPTNGKLGRDFGLADPDVTQVEILVEVKSLLMDNQLSASGREAYIPLYTTHRSFPADFNAALNMPIKYVDAPVLALGDPTNLEALGLTAGQIDTIPQIVLPTSRDIRVTMRPVCPPDPNYFGSGLTNRGLPVSFMVRKESAVEKGLFSGTGAENQLQGIYLQPDPDPLPLNRDTRFKILLGDRNANNPPDLVQRLAAQLGVNNKGFTLVGKPGKQVQFGCSRAIRHSLSPDSSNITISTKSDLLNHWIVAVKLVLNRDWTWDAVKTDSFLVQRIMKYKANGAIVAADPKENVGYIRLGNTANINSLLNPDRSEMDLVYLDAVEPKPLPGKFPDIIELEYIITPQFIAAPAADKPLALNLELPVTTNPSQIPVLASAGMALSKYITNDDYSATEAREKHLWFEFKDAPADPNDSFFIRLLNYAPDPLLAQLTPGLVENTQEPALPIDPELIRVISSGNNTDDEAGLDAMQEMIPAEGSDKHFLIPLPPGLHNASPELFGLFTYEIRAGHKKIWSTAQGRYGRPLRITGVQHPAPTLFCSVNRDELAISVSAPHAVAVLNGVNVTAKPPRTDIWALLYAQVTQADGQSNRNILLGEKLLVTPQPPVGLVPVTFKINRDAVVYSQTTWTNNEVSQVLALMGLPVSSSLSVICVEMMPNPNTYLDMVSNTKEPYAAYESSPIGVVAKPLESRETVATANAVASNVSPLGNGLGKFRILRTSPLTPVPFVCCT